MAESTNNFNWRITAKKFGIILLDVLLAGAIVHATDNQIYLALVPALTALRNWLKHRKLGK